MITLEYFTWGFVLNSILFPLFCSNNTIGINTDCFQSGLIGMQNRKPMIIQSLLGILIFFIKRKWRTINKFPKMKNPSLNQYRGFITKLYLLNLCFCLFVSAYIIYNIFHSNRGLILCRELDELKIKKAVALYEKSVVSPTQNVTSKTWKCYDIAVRILVVNN